MRVKRSCGQRAHCSKASAVAALLLILMAQPGGASERPGLTSFGTVGALTTPNALSQGYGTLAFRYSPYLDNARPEVVTNDGHNFILGFGALSFVDVSIRLATVTLGSNCFVDGCGGLRDLSLSAKVYLPDDLKPELLSDFDFAIGAHDQGGAATFYRGLFAVGSYQFNQRWSGSLGYNVNNDTRSQFSRLSGIFQNISFRAFPWLELLGEYNGNNVDVGVRASHQWRSAFGSYSLYTDLRTGAGSDSLDREVWWGAGFTLPLSRDLSAANARRTSTQARVSAIAEYGQADATAKAARDEPAMASADPQAPPKPSSLVELSERLAAAGLRHISIGEDQGRLVVRVENLAYLRSYTDAVGVVLAVVSKWSPDLEWDVQVQLMRERVVVEHINARAECIRAWLRQEDACSQQALYVGGGLASPAWQVKHAASSGLLPRLEVAPIFNYFLGTEYGALDFNPGVALTAEVPLGLPGLVAESRYITGLYESGDYRDGIFSPAKLQSSFNRHLIHQYWVGPRGLSAHVAYGLVERDFEGYFGEFRWRSPNGRHRVQWHGGSFENDLGEKAAPSITSYRYIIPGTEVVIGARAGEFFYGDDGFITSVQNRLGNVYISAFYRRTEGRQFDNPNEEISFAGLEIAFPLTGRRNVVSKVGVLKGNTSQFLSLVSEVNSDINRIFFSPPRGVFAVPPQSLDLALFDRDRLHGQYLIENEALIREAFDWYRQQQ